MKRHHLTACLAGLWLAGTLIIGLEQRRELARVREAPNQRAAASPASAPTTEPRPATVSPLTGRETAPPLSDAEIRELLTLRRDVAGLRARRPKIEQLQAENQRLRTALANAGKSRPDGALSPDSYMVASKAKFMGVARPADTLQSFLFAMRNRDTNALFQVLTPAAIASITEQMQREGPDKFLAGMGTIPGFLIKSLDEKLDGSVEAELQFDPNSPGGTGKLKLQRINGEWRLSLE